MNERDWLQLALYLGVLAAATPLLGRFLARVLAGDVPGWLRWLVPAERLVCRVGGVDPAREMRWTTYAGALLAFNAVGFAAVFALQLLQASLPLNPQGLPAVPAALAFNTAASFVTNTNWQAYSGEATLSHLVQMAGLTVQNFVSAATGMAVLLAFARGLARRDAATLGSFWADLVRTTLYVLLPLSLLLALALAGQGVVQTFAPNVTATTLEGTEQVIPLGPAASQVAIKQLGTNGGGFFGVNSAHPFENPTPLSNFLQLLAILLLPAAQVWMFGEMIGRRREGLAILGAMAALFLAALGLALAAETAGNPLFPGLAPMEGKEARFGVLNSVLWSQATTAASNGSVSAMHDSLTPLAGGLALFNILLGEVVFGGVGAGLYGMLLFVLLTVFLAGLMVGRTPEYLGKKIGAGEVRWVLAGLLAPCAVILAGAALSVATAAGRAAISNAGPHGLSQVLYAWASAAGNNGSAFAGLGVNMPFYNLGLGLAMLVGRFAVIIPCLALAGRLAATRVCPPSAGTFPTDSPLFVVMLTGVILLAGALTFLPALALGPVVEHLLMLDGRSF